MSWNQFPPARLTDEGTRAPRSVARTGERAAIALRAIHDMFEALPGDEARAWAALESRRRRKRHAWPLVLVGVAAGAGAIAVAAVPVANHAAPGPGATPVAAVQAHAPTTAAPAPVPTALRAGRSSLPGGLRANLRSGGRAAWVPTPTSGARVMLESGMLEIEADAPVDLRVASLRMDASAGRFRVTTHDDDDGVDVTVEAGEVAVWSSVRLLARVVAGERWTAPEPAAAGAAEPEPRATAAPATTHAHRARPALAEPAPAPAQRPDAPAEETPPRQERDCLRLARDGVTDAAIACFEAQAAQPGLTGEIALLELARIRRDVKGDLSGAERLLAEHGRRFPHSALAMEARSLRVELLLRLDRPAEALAEAERLTGAEAIFWRALGLETLGRRDEAARAFDDYLQHPGVERRGEATRRRRALGP